MTTLTPTRRTKARARSAPGGARHSAAITVVLAAVLLAAFVVSLGMGAVQVSPSQVTATVFGTDQQYAGVINRYRLPRELVAVLAGAALAVAGVLLQAALRNPLASPDVIGVSKGAGLAAMIVIMATPGAPVLALPTAALVGAAVVAAVLIGLNTRHRMSNTTLALSGVALGAICQAGMQYLVVAFPGDVNRALIWLNGSLFGRGWQEVRLLLPWVALLLPAVWFLRGKLDLLQHDDEVIAGIGENPRQLRHLFIMAAVALAGSSVAVIGSISFVGLLAPHMARRLAGHGAAGVLPAAALMGATLLVVSDTIGRALMPPVEVPVGIVTAVIGAPYFLYLVRRESRAR